MKDRSEVIQFPGAELLDCPSCSRRQVPAHYETLEFEYGRAPDVVKLSATVPVHTCPECNFSVSGDGAEELMHEAVCRHLGVMSPREVLGIRKRLGLSRASFATLTQLGEASLARWEGGALVQNSANDQYLYLLTFEENVQRLRARSSLPGAGEAAYVAPSPSPKFRALGDAAQARLQAANFRLRLVAQA